MNITSNTKMSHITLCTFTMPVWSVVDEPNRIYKKKSKHGGVWDGFPWYLAYLSFQMDDFDIISRFFHISHFDVFVLASSPGPLRIIPRATIACIMASMTLKRLGTHKSIWKKTGWNWHPERSWKVKSGWQKCETQELVVFPCFSCLLLADVVLFAQECKGLCLEQFPSCKGPFS